MGSLKDEMTNHMNMNGYAPKTVELYTSCVGLFSRYFMKSPVHISLTEIESFFIYLRAQNKSDSTVHIYYESLGYFYKMHDMQHRMPYMTFRHINNKLPAILSQRDVRTLLANCPSLKYRTIFSLIYSAGLRVSEAATLRISDIDFTRKLIFVRNGKNKKDRYTLLANETVTLLRQYFQIYHPVSFVFYANDITKGISTDCIQKYFRKSALAILNNPAVHVHTLRHCFATHLIENGTSIFYVMQLLGHSSILTTMKYLHMQDLDRLGLVSPIDVPLPPCSQVSRCSPVSSCSPSSPRILSSSQGDLFQESA
jgi:site-specific recombinase XerD